jgi:3-oxoacyl-[acyl-carrier protein] reductase
VQVPIRNQVVVITGATRGIGRATAIELARAGARLALLGRDEAALAEVGREVRELGADVACYAGDLRDHGRSAEIASETLERFHEVDALVNNAAVGKYGTFLELGDEDWHEMFDVNVLGLVAVTQAFLPGMLARGKGHVLNVSSVQGMEATSTSSAYSATKFALMGLSQSLAREMGPQGIRVSVLCPGSVETDFDGFPGYLKPQAMLPEEVAEAILDMLESAGRAHMAQVTLMPFGRRRGAGDP